MIRKTRFLEILEDIHKRNDMRYGQIINNALQAKFGRKDCDCGKGDGCKCSNDVGAAYDIFYTRDEDLTEIVEAYRFSLFPKLKRLKLTQPKKPKGTISVGGHGPP